MYPALAFGRIIPSENCRCFPPTERDAEERVISEAWEAPSEAAILLKDRISDSWA